MPGSEFAALRDCLAEPPSRQTYAAAAHALLRELRDQHEVNSGTDARLKRLYDRRDTMIEETGKIIAAENGLDLTDPLQRGRARVTVDDALERWETRETEDQRPAPTTPLETRLQKIYRHCELIKAIEDTAEFGGEEEDETFAPLVEPKLSLQAALGTAPLLNGERAADAIKGPPPATLGSLDDQPLPDTVLVEIRAVLAEIKAQLPAMSTSNALKTEISADIIQIETETERPSPRRKFVKAFLESLRDHLAKATGAAVAALLIALGAILATYFF
jgi:hypothetical protein